MMLLATKLAPPHVSALLVMRERLLGQLDATISHRLILLSAGAGWGKTTLLSAWASSRPYPVAWLSLDELDNNLTYFWIALIAALRTCVPKVGGDALAMLQSAEQAPVSAILTALLNDLTSVSVGAPAVLIIDDYHLINDVAIQEAMTFFIEHLPSHLHLVLATRVDPALPLSRWRVRGELLEIRGADLRFSVAEATSFFTQALGDGLADGEVRLLSRRSEGWIAGLQLALLAMRQRADRSAFVQAFTGSHRYLADYVQEEILAQQPSSIQRFLLECAVLRRMNAALCAALTEERSSQSMLESLERHNLFVVPLDDERQWYRMHDLFREVLLARLQASEPELAPVLHQRAAHWYAAHGELREAIAHALAAEDFAYAAGVIEREADQLWLSGEAQTVQSWISALPDVILQQHARLALNAALRLLESVHATVKAAFTEAQVQVEQMLGRLEALLQPQQASTASSESNQALAALPDTEVALLQRRMRLLRTLIASWLALPQGDTERMRLLAHEAEVLALPEQELSWKFVALWITFWLTQTLQGEGALLVPRLIEAKQQALVAGDQPAMIRVMRWLAFAYRDAGRLRHAAQECLEALALVEQISQRSAMTGYLHYQLACIYCFWNRLDEAHGALQQLLRIGHTWQQVDLLMAGHTLLVELALASGDLIAANQALQHAEDLAQQQRFANHASPVVSIRVRYWLAAGNLDAASAWAEQVVFSPETWNPSRKWEFLSLVGVYLARQHYQQALAALSRFSDELNRPGDIETTIGFLTLYAAALYHTGKREQGRAAAAHLLALTEQEDYIRIYLDAGEPMRELLQSLLSAPGRQEHNLPPASMAFVAKLLAAFGKTTPPEWKATHQILERPAIAPRPSELAEPLTRREREVLRLLMRGATNQEIAGELVISVATAKKHVSNLLGKLGVKSRSHAIARAHELSDLL
jgi:LuxR family maltose regulon positive regulatory protein